jgi:hypothetical protein
MAGVDNMLALVIIPAIDFEKQGESFVHVGGHAGRSWEQIRKMPGILYLL